MEMFNTPQDWLKSASDLPSGGRESSRLDWQSLAMRLAGAAACREAIDNGSCSAPVAGGSFDPASARRLARFGRGGNSDEAFLARDDCYHSRPVNRTDSVQIKLVPVIRSGTAGMLMNGDRGLI